MSKKSITTTVFFVIFTIGAFSFWYTKQDKRPIQQDPTPQLDQMNQNEQEPNETEQEDQMNLNETDVNNWKVYQDKDHRYELKHPETWLIDSSNGEKTFIYSSKFREDMPEGGGALTIEVKEGSLQDFIKEYNAVEHSQIVKEEKFSFDNISATKMTGTTAIGIDSNFIFVSHKGKNYLLTYHEFDPYHKKILSTFAFTD